MTTPNPDTATRARQLLNAYAEDVFLPLTDTVADVVLSSGEHVPVDRISAHALRVIALPVIADLLAEYDAAVARAERLEAAIRAHEDLHRPVGPDSPNGPIHMDGWPCCDDDRHLWAAADRGDTDGDRNEGDEE